MLQNLKEFVNKLVQKQDKSSFPHLYIINRQDHFVESRMLQMQPNLTLQQKQHKGSMSRIYTLHSKPLTIQPKSIGQNTQKIGVVLLIQSGKGIHIKMHSSQHEVNINGLKVSHTGNDTQLQMQLIEHQHILNIFQDSQKQADQLQHQYINRVCFNKIDNMIMYVEMGKVNISMCVFSLKYLVKSCRVLIPAICIDKEGDLYMVDCQIKGNQQKDTVGVLCKLGTVNAKNCIISDHREGGIVIWGVKDNMSKITKNKIQKNSIGIHTLGQEFKMKICQNQIIKNKTGIKVGLACQIQISRNYICENNNGIQAYSSFPLIYLNKINKNLCNGICVFSYKKMLCAAKIKRNVSITGNKKNGILIQGQNNKSKVVENYLVGFNSESGIRISKQSFPLVLKNKIYKNYNQGILITEDANAVVQKNIISQNVQCNIALGGIISHNTLIVQNQITKSTGPGIVMVEGMASILRNDITYNMQGIKLLQSSGRIRRNFISHNQNNGIECQGHCNPTLVQNLITRNSSIGLFMRSEISVQNQIMMHSNIIVSNQINVGFQFRNQSLANNLKFSNTIEGIVRQPQSLGCSIM